MGEHNSPYFAAGLEDGERDAQLLSSCPPGAALGMDASREWSWMYRRGYDRSFNPVPCICDRSCERKTAPIMTPDNAADNDGGGVDIQGGGVDIWA